ncbi:hypothetical protein OPV22_001167 [Ensete ventricosum]|uniref:Uncharacterized protein n=1 Tax=Ensete ventricosum TaxID=4639 RepID=A0AAV8RW29_ENSVE|nr:hypothetical protein OPV22_001167 [Ensete ventricosum]
MATGGRNDSHDAALASRASSSPSKEEARPYPSPEIAGEKEIKEVRQVHGRLHSIVRQGTERGSLNSCSSVPRTSKCLIQPFTTLGASLENQVILLYLSLEALQAKKGRTSSSAI